MTDEVRTASGAIAPSRARLQRLARIAEWVALLGAVVVVLFCLWLIANPAELTLHLLKEIREPVETPTLGVLYLAGTIALVPSLLFAWALWQAYGLFGRMKSVWILDPKLPGIIVRLGRTAFATAVAGLLARPLVGLLMTSANPPGHRLLVIGISTDEIAGLIVGLLLLAFALVMQEAVRLEDDVRGFV